MDDTGHYVMFTFRLQAARVLAFVLTEGDLEITHFSS